MTPAAGFHGACIGIMVPSRCTVTPFSISTCPWISSPDPRSTVNTWTS